MKMNPRNHFIIMAFVVMAMLLGFQNCGKEFKQNSITSLSSNNNCTTSFTMNIPLEIFSIDQDFAEVTDITVENTLLDSTCPDIIDNGLSEKTFVGSVARESGTLFIGTNLTKKSGDPFVLRFYKNSDIALPSTIEQFCESENSLVSLTASGSFDQQSELLRVNITTNKFLVSSCPQTGSSSADTSE